MARKQFVDNSKDFHNNPFLSCACEPCQQNALYKVKTKTGWANFCDRHYDDFYSKQAVSNLTVWGMERSNGETQEQHVKRMRHFFRNAFKRFSSKSPLHASESRK